MPQMQLPTLALRRMSWRRAFKGKIVANLIGNSAAAIKSVYLIVGPAHVFLCDRCALMITVITFFISGVVIRITLCASWV